MGWRQTLCSPAAAIALGYFLIPTTGHAELVRYDPERCATDVRDQVFVRLQSGLAFAFPADDLLMLRGPVNDPRLITDPSEPEGCPLNPIVTSGFAVAYRPARPPYPGEPEDARWQPQLLQIFGHAGPTRLQESNLKFFHRYCIKKPDTDPRAHRLVEVSPILRECRVEQVDRSDDRDWPSYIVARPGAHLEFGGRPFAVHCYGSFLPGGSRECTADYQIESGLSVMYRFQDAIIPREHIAEFDLQIRAFVAARRTPEYDVDVAE
jgi:hypothetical protein